MPLRNLADARELFSSLRGSLVGVGMTAYSRIVPSYLLQPYHIVALRKTGDLEILRKRAEIFCLEEEIGAPVQEEGFNSARLLSHPLSRRYLQTLPEPVSLLLYQSYPELEDLAGKEHWILLGNPGSLRTRVGDRAFFSSLVEELHLRRIEGTFMRLDELWSHEYGFWAKRWGPGFVVQLPEVQQGGGKGTFFILTDADFRRLQRRLSSGMWRGSRLNTISLRRHVEGTAASLALCITRHGVLLSCLQRQLIDLPYCKGIPVNGVFCGHSWGGDSWPAHIREGARVQGLSVGERLREMGYRGILGIDFVIEAESGSVYPVEINARFTGAFPMLSQLHMAGDLIPMDVFHMLEFLGTDYDTDCTLLNAAYEGEMRGSHLLLFTLGHGRRAPKAGLRGGLYELLPGGEDVRFVRDASDYREITHEGQFIVIDGPPGKEIRTDDPLYRLCRILFSYPVARPDGEIRASALLAAERIHRRMMG
ncbi:MAG: ATP-grasp domain-containing protein [Thermodesulfobacteriota bacterium]